MIIMIIITILSTIGAIYIYKSRDIDEATVKEASNADLAFAVLGDIHKNTSSFKKAIKDLYKINSNMDVLVLNGDSVDQGSDKQYNSIKNVLNKNKKLLPLTIIKNIGNHEFFEYDISINSPEQVQGFINRYLEFAGESNVYHDTWVRGYHFISLGSEDGNSETLNSIAAFISDKQLKWFEEKLGANYQKGKPIFVFLHQPLDYGNGGWIGVKQSEQIKEILSRYPEVILFSSHSHSDLNESSVILNKPFTIVNTGAVHYTIIRDENSESGRRRKSYIKGVYVEVKGNNVTIKGRDIKEKKWIFTKVLP